MFGKGGDLSPPKKKFQFVPLPLALLHPRKRSLCGFGQAAHATPGLYQKLSVPNHLFKINSFPKNGNRAASSSYAHNMQSLEFHRITC